MAISNRLRTLVFCALLQMGVMFGMPMRPEEIRDLMRAMNQQQIAQYEPERDDRPEAE